MTTISEPHSHQNALAVRAIVGELAMGPVCVKCIATRGRFTRFAVEEIVARLRRAFIVDTPSPCVGCGGSGALALNARAA